MLPSGSPNPMGGSPSMNPSLLRTNSGILVPGGQAGSMPAQQQFTQMMPQRAQFANGPGSMSLPGNVPNMSALLSQSFGSRGQGAAQMNLQQRAVGGGEMDMVLPSGEHNPLSFGSGQPQGQQFQNPQGTQLGSEHPQTQQVDATAQNFQQQFSGQQQSLRGALGAVGSVKLEQQIGGPEQNGPSQQLQPLCNLSTVKVEPQQLPPMKGLGSVKLEPQHSDPSLFLQQQQLLHLSRQTPQTAAQMNILQQQQQQQQQQQRILQLQQQQQQQQQQQLLKSLPQQRPQLQQQQQQQQAISLRSLVKPSVYEPGMCARRLTQYMYHQQHRPADNNIEFWRKFVNEYFSPHAKKRWCVSLYGSGRQTTGVFPQDVWHCEICNRKPGRGFETTVEVLPRLLKIKYDSGTLEELLYVDMPREYQNASGQIVLDYAKAIQESVFEQLRIVRDGQLRIVFSSDLKICSWEFCARRHEELIPRRIIVPQVNQLGALAQKYQSATQNSASTSTLSSQDLQSTCDSFVAHARQLAKALEVPLVNDLGYTKRYVRCLQISEVVNSMKDLIDYSRETGTGPIASLINFPRKISSSSTIPVQALQQSEEQQSMTQTSNHNDLRSVQTSNMQLASSGTGVMTVNNTMNPSASMVLGGSVLLHQNSTNSRVENSASNMNSPYGGGTTVQIPSTSSSTSLPLSQPNPCSFPSPTPSASNSNNNNEPQNSNGNQHLTTSNSPVNISVLQRIQTQQQQQIPHLGQPIDTEMSDSQASVQQIIQEMMMSSQLNGVSPMGNEMKVINRIIPGFNGANCLVGNGITNRSNISGMGYGNIGGMGASPTATAIRATTESNGMFNGRVGINTMAQDLAMNQQQQQEMGNRLLNSGLGSMNNLQFDWKNTR